jgi:hypothetical protein
LALVPALVFFRQAPDHKWQALHDLVPDGILQKSLKRILAVNAYRETARGFVPWPLEKLGEVVDVGSFDLIFGCCRKGGDRK